MRDFLLDWARAYCRNDFDEDNLPGGVEIFLDRAELYLNQVDGKQSESLGDYSVSYVQEFPASLTSLLEPYKKVRFI